MRVTRSGGVAESADTVYVKHSSGGESMLVFKSYDQKRRSFQGTEREVIWLDEEPPMDIYSEGLTRTAATHGINVSLYNQLPYDPLKDFAAISLTCLVPQALVLDLHLKNQLLED